MHALLGQFHTIKLLGLDLVDASLDEVAPALAARSPALSFSYLVTPNADHFVRLARDLAGLTPRYQAAGGLLLDSRVVRRLGLALRLRMPPVVTGSDLTAALFQHHIAADEPVTIVGTTPASVKCLTDKFALTRVAHLAPPFGFESDPALVERCAEFVRAHPARFVFLACGAPRQELLAHRIAQTGGACGIGLCIGAAIDQIGGFEQRAPRRLRQAGLEWTWRISREPQRMGRRYLQDLAIVPALLKERLGARSADAVARGR